MESKHTPGPWEARENGWILTEADGYIAQVSGGDPPLSHQGIMAKAKANAKLIAAAPELLAIVAKTADVLRTMLTTGTGKHFLTVPQAERLYGELDAAREKATE